MSINAQSINQSFVKRLTVINSRSAVECRFSGEGISEVLAVCPQVNLSNCEVTSGRVNYGGRLVCTAVYADGHGRLSRIQKGAEFTHFADDECLAPAHTAICSLTCEKATIRRDGTSFIVTAVISARITIYATAERNFLTSIEGAVCKTEDISFCNAVTFSGESEVEDDFEAANVADILMHDAKVITTDCRCGAGEIQISGEIYLSMLALRSDEPVALDRIIPFSAEIVCDQAAFARKADCLACIKDASVAAQVDEERGRCNLRFTAQLSFNGSFIEETQVQAVTDAFCIENELETELCSENTAVCEDIKMYTERVNGTAATGVKLDYSCSLKVALSPKAECTYSADTGLLEGAVTCVLIFSREGELHSTDITLPFSVKLNGIGGDVRIDVAVIGISVRQRSEGECEAEATLKIAAANYVLRKAECISEAEEGEREENFPAVTVLVPQAGDALWDIAKKLKRTPQDISSSCPDLTFPLNGSERVVIYRPKII